MLGGTSLAQRHQALRTRAKILSAIRAFFLERGFLEVETPHRIPIPIPEAHIDVITSGTWVLQPSPEICMKRMLAAGYERIFQLCRCWRDGERGRLHLPEFSMLEWYRANADYTVIMDDCEQLVRAAAWAAGTGGVIRRNGQTIDLSVPWEKLTVNDAFKIYGGMPAEEALKRDLFDEILVRDIEPLLGTRRPTILTDYPATRGSLARLKPGSPQVAERFEFYIGGIEIANAFSELDDPGEQRDRFVKELEFRASMAKPVFPLPEKFLSDLSSMPPSAGIALGLDRLVMLLLEASSVDEVVCFTPEEL